jgi:hypothetical protein
LARRSLPVRSAANSREKPHGLMGGETRGAFTGGDIGESPNLYSGTLDARRHHLKKTPRVPLEAYEAHGTGRPQARTRLAHTLPIRLLRPSDILPDVELSKLLV